MQQATSASAVLNRLWNGYLPVDVYGIAQAYGIEIREEPGRCAERLHLYRERQAHHAGQRG